MAFIHKHTTGDWKKEKHHSSSFEIKNKEDLIAFVNAGFDGGIKEVDANAKLIANAPKLLEIAEMFHDFLLQKKNQGSIAFDVVKKTIEDCGVEIENHV